MGLLGADIAAIGVYWQVIGLTLSGALISALATLVLTVKQAESREQLAVANQKLLEQSADVLRSVIGHEF
ncbi:MAG: hypothetical protein H7251_08445 [Acetobacteraceae bacterium]|nr:hypothetical protein [Acetobacteraceae bacterium]